MARGQSLHAHTFSCVWHLILAVLYFYGARASAFFLWQEDLTHMTGTFLNIGTVLLGGTAGLMLGSRLPEQTRRTLMGGIGLVTLVVGMQMALSTRNVLIVLFSVLFGGLVGEWLQLDAHLNAIGEKVQQRLGRGSGSASRVSEGFITASLVFCVGPMTILGAIQDGLVGDYRLLAIKSVLDGFTAMAFAATLGWGVLLSVITLLVYQGGISLAAMALAGAWTTGVSGEAPAIVELTATGGVLIIGIGLLLLDVKRLPIANYLPAIGIAPLLVLLVQRLNIG